MREVFPTLVTWRNESNYFHILAGRARQDSAMRYEAVLRDQAMNGIEEKLFTASGEPVWLIDPVAAAMDEGDRWLYKDWPFQHGPDGGRLQATRRNLIPATTRNLVISSLVDSIRAAKSMWTLTSMSRFATLGAPCWRGQLHRSAHCRRRLRRALVPWCWNSAHGPPHLRDPNRPKQKPTGPSEYRIAARQWRTARKGYTRRWSSGHVRKSARSAKR